MIYKINFVINLFSLKPQIICQDLNFPLIPTVLSPTFHSSFLPVRLLDPKDGEWEWLVLWNSLVLEVGDYGDPAMPIKSYEAYGKCPAPFGASCFHVASRFNDS